MMDLTVTMTHTILAVNGFPCSYYLLTQEGLRYYIIDVNNLHISGFGDFYYQIFKRFASGLRSTVAGVGVLHQACNKLGWCIVK